MYLLPLKVNLLFSHIHSEVLGGWPKEVCRRLRSAGANMLMVHLLRLEQGGKRRCSSKAPANRLPHMYIVQYPCNLEFIELSRRIFYLYAVFQTSTSILLTITLNAKVSSSELH